MNNLHLETLNQCENNLNIDISTDMSKQLILGCLGVSLIFHLGMLNFEPIQKQSPMIKPVNLISAQLLKAVPIESQAEETKDAVIQHKKSSELAKREIASSNHNTKNQHKIIHKKNDYKILTNSTNPKASIETESHQEVHDSSTIQSSTSESKHYVNNQSQSTNEQKETKSISSEESEKPKAKAKPEFRKASYLYHPKPEYPTASKQNNEQGKVILKVLVNAQGKPEDIQLQHSSGYDRLDQSALNAVQRWTFKPAIKDGENTDSWVIIPIPFHLNHIEDDE